MYAVTNLNRGFWQLAWCDTLAETHGTDLQRRPVELPNHVQTSAFGLPQAELYRAKNTATLAWMAEKFWVYAATIDVPAVPDDHEACLVFDGIDYDFEIRLDGACALRKEGMWSATTLPVSEGPRRVEVVIYPPCAPGQHPGGFDYDAEPKEHLKARFSREWDWAPRLVTSGIWQDVALQVRPRLRVEHAWVATRLVDARRACCTVRVELTERLPTGECRVELAGHVHTVMIQDADAVDVEFTIDDPALWWPNGLGPSNLVTLVVNLSCDDRVTEPYTTRTGLREIRKQHAAGQNPDHTPHQLLINRQRVFVQGGNWVPADCCFADVDADRYALLLKPFADAGFNMLRVWGGGLIEKQAFYDLADEYGLMIMQEFPLACEIVPETETFLANVTREMCAFVPELNRHPCIVMWTGGNEHYHIWDNLNSGTPIMEAARPGFNMPFWDEERCIAGVPPYTNKGLCRIGALFDELDGTRPFQPTSGMEGEGEPHGIWNWDPRIGDQRMRDYDTCYAFWNAATENFYSEASVEGIALRHSIEHVLDTTTPEVPDPDDPVWRHHKAFESCWPLDRDFHPNRRSTLWLDLASIDALFGPLTTLDDLIRASHWLQAEGGRYMVEALSRNIPQTCGFLWWGANEPWPNLAGNQLVDYFGASRPALHALANAFKPVLLTLRYEHCVLAEFGAETWISNKKPRSFLGTVTVRTEIIDGGSVVDQQLHNNAIECSAYSAQRVSALDAIELRPGMRLRITTGLADSTGKLCHENTYLFSSAHDRAPMRPFLDEGALGAGT